MNDTKSFILDLGVAPQDRLHLQARFPYTWSDQKINYLGINLTSQPSQLFKANYLPLEQKLREGLRYLSKHILSWSGKFEALKMQILPQVLYIYRTVPIPVHQGFFQGLQSMLTKSLWEGWFPGQSTPLWGSIEETIIPGGNLYDYVLAYPHLKVKLGDLSPPVIASLNSWKALVLSKSLLAPVVPMPIPVSTLALIIPELHLIGG